MASRVTGSLDFGKYQQLNFVVQGSDTPPVADADAVGGFLWLDTSLSTDTVMKYWDAKASSGAGAWVRMDGGGDIPNGMIVDRHVAADAAIQWSKIAHPTDLATTGDITTTNGNVSALGVRLDTLEGNDAGSSVRQIAESAISDAGLDGAFVTLNTDQTVGGVKTFSSSPVVPVATTATQAVQFSQLTAVSGSLASEVTNRTNADTALGTRIDGVASDLATEATSRADADTSIRTDFAAADTALGTLITNETNARTSADTTLTTNLASEVTRATAAEGANATAITAETSRATTAEGVNAAAIGAETSRAEGAEGTLTTAVSDEVTRAEGVEAGLRTDLNAEITRATGAEGTLTSDLAAEVTRATTAEGANATAISNEVTRATGAEGALSDAAATESTRVDSALALKADLDGPGGKLLTSQLPALSIGSVQTAADLDALYALSNVQEGDTVVVTGVGTFMRDSSTNAGTDPAVTDATNWIELTAPSGGASGADLAAEIARAEAAEAALSAADATEVTNRIAGDAANATAIGAETTRATAAEGALSDAAATEHTARVAAESTLTSAISDEAATARAAESANATAISAEASTARAAESTLTSNLAAEVTRATAAEGANATAISGEVTRATAAEGVNTAAITAEVSRAEAAESDLSAQLATEVSDRAAAVSAEASTRATNDTALGGRIDGVVSDLTDEVTRATGAESGLNALITGLQTELNSTESDVSGVTGRVSSLESSRTTDEAAISALQSAVTTEASNRATEDTTLQNQLTTLQGDSTVVGSVARAVAQEASARSAADTSLNNSLTAEITDRTTADTALSDAITGETSARQAADSSIRSDFATADSSIRSDFATADAAVTTAFQTADSGLQADINTRALDSNTVHQTGDETVGGTKTFTSPVGVPDGVANGDAVNLSQLTAAQSAATYDDTVVRGLITTAQGTADLAQSNLDTFEGTKGQANGLASLDSNGKVPLTQIPGHQLTNVTYYADMTARDAATGSVEGDVAIVGDNGSGVRQSFIWDGAANDGAGGWVPLMSPADVTEAELAAAVSAGLTTINSRIDGLDAGDGLVRTGDRFDVVGTSGRISVGADSIDIDTSYVGQGSINTLGTVTTGTWNASVIPLAYGGTGFSASDLDALIAHLNIGVTGLVGYSKTLSDMVDGTPLTVTHNLGTTNILASVKSSISGQILIGDVTVVDANSVSVVSDPLFPVGEELILTLVGVPVDGTGQSTRVTATRNV